MITESKNVKIGIIAVFFLFIALFSFFRSTDLIFGVKIKNVELNDEPAESGIVTEKSVTEISGRAKNVLNLTLNDREISVDIEGNFLETIALNPGYNIVSIRALDKFGYVDEKDYQIILME